MEEVQEIKELRSKEECEKQLAVELAVGAVDSIDSLIDQGHEVAYEYACQLLFDNLRQKVAARENLPIRIVRHLLKDRCDSIRMAVIKTNWKSLTNVQQEEIICEAELLFSQDSGKNDHQIAVTARKHRNRMRSIIEPLLKDALSKRDEPTALRYVKILGVYDGLPLLRDDLVLALKEMPTLFHVYWVGVNSYNRKANVILAHPDENVRMEEVQKILDKKTRVTDLYKWASTIGRARQGEGLKVKILKLWVTDPSEAIRRFIAMTTTNVEVLEMLSTDESNAVSQVAYPRYKKFQKRYAYSKAYHERKHKRERGYTN